jgi:hypothetical protein
VLAALRDALHARVADLQALLLPARMAGLPPPARMAAAMALSGLPWARKGIVSREIATALMKVGGLNLDDAKLIATIR